MSEVKNKLLHKILPSAINSISEGFVVVDNVGDVIFFNNAFDQLLGGFESQNINENWRAQYGLYNKDDKIIHKGQAPLYNAINGRPSKDVVLKIKN